MWCQEDQRKWLMEGTRERKLLGEDSLGHPLLLLVRVVTQVNLHPATCEDTGGSKRKAHYEKQGAERAQDTERHPGPTRPWGWGCLGDVLPSRHVLLKPA